jgi:hypothetical protein
MSRAIERALARRDWKEARRLVRAALRRQPDSHWLLTRLSLTYYAELDYERALAIGQQAHAIAPRCPLVLWDLAGTLDMLGRHREAIAIFHRLIRRGVAPLASGECGEGVARARGLVTDCWYRLGRCHRKLDRRAQAVRCFRHHLAWRGPGCRSIYSMQQVRGELLSPL